MMKITITKPKKEDFDEIFPLLKQLWLKKRLNKKVLRSIFLKQLNNPNRVFLIAKHEGVVVGFISMFIRDEFIYQGKAGTLDEFIVKHGLRGQNIGTRLLRNAARIAKSKGCKAIELPSGFRRKRAHRFYEKRGFQKTDYFFRKTIK